MDFPEQDLDLFGELSERENEGGEESGSSSSASSSSSSSSSSSGSRRSGSDRSSSGNKNVDRSSGSDSEGEDEEDVERDRRSEGGEEEEEEVEQGEENDDEKDLFGSDSEDYCRTLPVSPFPVPTCPVARQQRNQNRGGYGRGHWHSSHSNDGVLPTPLLPRPGSFQQRHGQGGFGFIANGRSEHFISDLKLPKSEETLSRKCVAIQEPCELACYSRDESGEVYFDDRCLRLFRLPDICKNAAIDLNEGFESFIDKRDTGSHGFGDLLACIRDKGIPLQNIHFVTFRNNLNKILETIYNKYEPWEMGVHKRKGVVYLDVHKLPERPQTELDRRRCYWGYSFEKVATEDPRRDDMNEFHPVDANVEFCSVIKTKLGAHRIIMGAEMDCYDVSGVDKKYYVELKTSRELDYHTVERFERQKLLKFWIQSFLAGVPYIMVGFRDDAGHLLRVERLSTKDITQRVKLKNYWQGGVCLAFADEVLCWLYGTVRENEDYILQFCQPFTRLELLRAHSCPSVITDHVQQL